MDFNFKGFYDEIIFDVDKSILKSYTGKQGDTKSRGLYIAVTQKNAVIDDLTGLSMRLFYEKPDKTRGFIDGVVDGNKFRIDYTNQMYAVPGVVKAELRLMGVDGEIITAKTFKILVDSSIADGSIVSKNERGILDRAFELAEDIIPRLELLDVELLEDVQAEILGARHSGTKDVTYDSLGQRLDAAEQDLLDHKAEYTSNRQQDQLKIAKVEKELNDYKATMQQINIHQSPTQKATGHGIISLPPNAAEGQVSVTVKGNTETDEEGNTKSTIGAVRIKSVGKNLLNLSNGQQTINGITIVVDDGEVLINGTTTSNVWIKLTGGFEATSSRLGRWTNDSLRIKPGNYTLSRNSISGTGTSTTLGIRNQNDERAIGVTQTTNSETGFLDDNLSYVYLYIASGAVFNNYRFRPQLEIGEKATDYESYKESNAYVIAKNEEGNILKLRSLPNGTKDELCVSTGKLIKRVSDEVKTWNLTWSRVEGADTNDYYGIRTYDLNSMPSYIRHSVYMSKGEHTTQYTSGYSNKNDLVYYDSGHGTDFRFKVPKSAFTNNWTLAETQAWLEQNQITLTYQLAEPVEIPIQVSGALTSYPNGTVYIEPFVADAGVYTDKIEVLHDDLPIKAIEKVSKVDFMTGIETELDISQAEISEDKLSFTHPDLSEGDIVFFEYEYDVESTDGEAEVEYYDSRYVVKDDVTGKFYKWNVKVSNGTPTIELVEV